MQIDRLKLTGFKSFVEPAELRIEPGLTGVVGPNGCGKSNLLEAIRWVMGENSPKSMRSGGMEDVIFAGTASRPQRDFAEVVLHAASTDGEELEVMRRIERGAGSAYRINGDDVRAKDVALTFADAATGAHSPALVSQGKIAQVIAAKPAERRAMLEEAAGISGLHVRRRDAESKLRSTEKNLARLEDLTAGLDTRIASLKRQAKQAERYTRLTGQIQLANAQLVFARWRDATEAADAARAEAKGAEQRVEGARIAADQAQGVQQAAARTLGDVREELADRRDDATAHGHRMAALSSQLEAAEQRLADLDRQKQRLEEDQGDADRLTRDAADALARLQKDIDTGAVALAQDEARRSGIAASLDNAERASRAAELALAKATADQAEAQAEWRVGAAALEQAEARLARIDTEASRLAEARKALGEAEAAEESVTEARLAADTAAAVLAETTATLEDARNDKIALQQRRDDAGTVLAEAQAALAGIVREHTALTRDREAREKAAAERGNRALAIDRIRAEPGYERALAAVLGRDANAPLGAPDGEVEGRYWTGRDAPLKVADCLAEFVTECPLELAARLALVHVADSDDGRILKPGEWLVTRGGFLRRWDGFIARGEGASETARLEAANRLAELGDILPQMRDAADAANAEARAALDELTKVQQRIAELERTAGKASGAERQALRTLDQAEAVRERTAARRAELEAAETELAARRTQADSDIEQARATLAALPPPDAGKTFLQTAQTKNDAARIALQAASAALASHDQALAVARERSQAQRSDMAGWEARSGDAAKRLSDMAARLDEIEQERAVIATKPEGLLREIEQGDAVRDRITAELETAQTAVSAAQSAAETADTALTAATEALSQMREARVTLTARAENAETRRNDAARASGERFGCPPPLLPDRFAFDEADVTSADSHAEKMERLTVSRERIGPVNLVAADELEALEGEHASSAAEQAELAEAVSRLRGSIGSLNREGRARLRTAFDQVDTHFRHLFARLFDAGQGGGAAHLALIDSDDPLEAGLEIFAQPPGKKLQSLTLLSGGEQALTAVALIFALFLTNPSPICVLDEVDAPLDDANIERFCDLLDVMTRETDTRYLIVTHNAVTMSRMHRLFGVTMIEQGVSRLVSVDLGAAEELLAAE
ncbi:Chromosome partition protein Smc [Alteripontixanthobacter maritimus]|uniref:Chromosome partition protein Smc n=1 Tax=Alteripontixanthobacter maritimus TaxID=2161824 RepID=A0A369Q7S2_9SPHN|nr:AAA family ATPase [Alteripontixanthobacter maritimus]RDC59575.1 Chromosome partition protein Smc [Alteripontixanthobacter maritimus]